MTAEIRLKAARHFKSLLLGTACAAAVFAGAARAAGPDTASGSWLGKISATAPAVAGKQKPAAMKSKPDAETAQQLAWWSVGGPAYRWNEIILDEIQDGFVVLPMAARHLALYHAAIDDAVVDARALNGAASGKPAASEHAAVAVTASTVLTHLFPARAAHFTKKAEEAVMLRATTDSDTAEAITTGQAIGQKVAAAAIERAKTDGSDAKWTGSIPEGPDRWKGTNPIAPLAGTWRPWVLASVSELRPAAPPSIDSQQMKTDLAELKTFPRTPKTNHRAIYWEVHGGARAHTLWNEIARTKLMEYGKGEQDGARVLAALNIALADAGVACWDAKYAFWYIRPPQLDPELKSLFAPPNHPSFPAAHGCFSTAAATVLASVFPRDRERILALGKEAAEARVWAGIHYRFDIDAGQEIGRKVGEKVLARAFPHAVR